MKKVIVFSLVIALLLSGCGGIYDSSYANVRSHEQADNQKTGEIVSVKEYSQLYEALKNIVAEGREIGIISVAKYDQERISGDTKRAIATLLLEDPIAAYAAENITFELGTNSGQAAVAVTVTYLHDSKEIGKIRKVDTMEDVQQALASTMDSIGSGIVLYVAQYTGMDVVQWTSEYMLQNPDKVMERPEITVNIYPEQGDSRVMEIKFQYQNSRESLKEMQSVVEKMVNAAVIFAEKDSDEAQKYLTLYSVLRGLFQTYQFDTSITPAYSLLQYGVGDSKAFATVYGALCRKAGLTGEVVLGTRAGEPWYWNIIRCGEEYYHVDPVECVRRENFTMKSDWQMTGYVWDYSAYPVCGGIQESEKPEETEPAETVPEIEKTTSDQRETQPADMNLDVVPEESIDGGTESTETKTGVDRQP